MRRLPLILLFAAGSVTLHAQDNPFGTDAGATTGATGAAKSAGKASGVNPSAGGSAAESLTRAVNINSLESGTLLKVINQAFDTNSDAIDPEKGTMNWKGHSYDVGQFRVFRGRFERYLSLPATRDQDDYAATVTEIFNRLSTRTANGSQENIVAAWKLLYRAAEFEADGGNSLGVANQVFNAWRIRDEKEAIMVTQSELQRIRRQQSGRVVYSADVMASETGKTIESVASSALLGNLNTGGADSGSTTTTTDSTGTKTTTGAGAKKSGDGSAPRQTIGSSTTVGGANLTMQARDLAETEVKIKSLEAAGMLSVTQAKLQFQSQIMSLFMQRRFQHALIAASFYRYIFKGSHQNLEVGKKELSSFLPSTDLAMTVETIEFLSREAINDVNSGMSAVGSSYDGNRKIAALERLQETFFLGEYLPAVTQFDPARKDALLTLYRKVDEARKLADLKDYEAVIHLTDEIGTLTGDFRSAEVNAAVRSAQRMSTLALSAAQQVAATGDYAKAQELVEKSAQLWPLNPSIKNYSENMASQADMGTQAGVVFDDAFKRDDFRRIYERRAELAAAFLNDGVRAPQLKAVIDRMARVEIYLAQTEELLAQNNAFSAWEALVAAVAFAPNDVVLNQRMAQLAPRVAEFVGRLDQAKRYEADQRFAASLTQYLAAQDIHPASQLARTGLSRVSESIMTQLSTEVPAPIVR
ncbi:MAG: hypothetical protein H2172_05625 [Opitutus sp.]|nr:hypothetical protein [Opitutus sp.]MCS6246942.1 hypothetical protein [Opitutus sp.]MCS6273163.1 hypothetical protein [Opitutus sp.]MCS6279068.1 hypothetical protein [Opitutus sp.]MCS6298597.1 hypothetical protein [Opitutus sp.]